MCWLIFQLPPLGSCLPTCLILFQILVSEALLVNEKLTCDVIHLSFMLLIERQSLKSTAQTHPALVFMLVAVVSAGLWWCELLPVFEHGRPRVSRPWHWARKDWMVVGSLNVRSDTPSLLHLNTLDSKSSEIAPSASAAVGEATVAAPIDKAYRFDIRCDILEARGRPPQQHVLHKRLWDLIFGFISASICFLLVSCSCLQRVCGCDCVPGERRAGRHHRRLSKGCSHVCFSALNLLESWLAHKTDNLMQLI